MLVLAGGDTVDEAVARRLRTGGRSLVVVAPVPLEAPALAGETRVVAEIAGTGWQGWCENCSEAVLVLPVTPFDLSGSGRPSVACAHAERAVEACRAMGIERLVCISVAGAAADAPHPDLQAAYAAETLIRSLTPTRWQIVRRAASFGPGDSFSQTLVQLVHGVGAVPVPHPTGLVQPIAADEVAATAVAALASDREGITTEVGGAERLSLDELLRRTMRAVGARKSVVRVSPRVLRAVLPLANKLGLTSLSRAQLAVMAVGSVCPSGGNGAAGVQARYEGPVWLAGRPRRPD